jgi:hypothetical protein
VSITTLTGRPGVYAGRTAGYRNVFKAADLVEYFPGGGLVAGASRDHGNAEDPLLLRPGLLMGRVTATLKWAPCFIGTTVGAYTSGGTSVTVSAAQAAEVVRRIGTAGNLYYLGPPTAAGTVTLTGPIAFSAVNTATGVITTASLGVNKISGTLLVAGDGSEVPRSVIPDGFGLRVPGDGTDAEWPHVPVGGHIESAKVIDWPTDTSLRQYIVDSMAANGAGRFLFDHLFNPAA